MPVAECALIQLVYLKPDSMSSDFRIYRPGSHEISESLANLYSVACYLDENINRIKLIFEKSQYDWGQLESRSSVSVSDNCALARVVLWHVDAFNGLSAKPESGFSLAKIADAEFQPPACFWVVDLSNNIVQSRDSEIYEVIDQFEKMVDEVKRCLR